MYITFNLDFWWELTRNPYFPIIKWSLIYAFSTLLLFAILRIVWRHWLKRIRKKYRAEQEYILLAIDVPKNNEQGPEAVERLFAHLAGIKGDFNWVEKYVHGYIQLSISLEIISIEGHIQFLARTPVQFRDMVEAAIYGSYSDAEIFEVEDYTEDAPDEFPNDEYELWGTDLVLYNKNPFPIRTYPSFEHKLTGELKDPIVDLLEILAKLRKGEQVWFQFIIKPIGPESAYKEGYRIAKKMMGEDVKFSKKTVEKLVNLPAIIIEGIGNLFFAGPSEGVKERERKKTLTPGDKLVAEAIQMKMSKISFETKIRLIYLAEKDVFNKIRGAVGVLGALNAINTLNMNGLAPYKKAKTIQRVGETIRSLEIRQQAIMAVYKKRKRFWTATRGIKRVGEKIFDFLAFDWRKKKDIMNIEELATLYHFPVITTKAPLIKKTSSKRGEPPIGLPTK